MACLEFPMLHFIFFLWPTDTYPLPPSGLQLQLLGPRVDCLNVKNEETKRWLPCLKTRGNNIGCCGPNFCCLWLHWVCTEANYLHFFSTCFRYRKRKWLDALRVHYRQPCRTRYLGLYKGVDTRGSRAVNWVTNQMFPGLFILQTIGRIIKFEVISWAIIVIKAAWISSYLPNRRISRNCSPDVAPNPPVFGRKTDKKWIASNGSAVGSVRAWRTCFHCPHVRIC